MIEKANEVTAQRDELDLLTLVESAISFFKSFGLTILIFSVAGILLGYLRYRVTPKEYSSTLILHSRIITNQEQLEIVKTWDDLLKRDEYEILASTFNCDPKILEKVGEISGEEIQKLYVPDNPNGFTVKVLVTDTGILDSLQTAIVYGLQNSEYVKERVALRRSDLNALIQKVTTEISALDSTKSNVENIINNKHQNQSSFIIDVSGINRQLIDLNEKLYGYLEELKFLDAVHVLQNFNKLKKPETPKLLSSLVLGLIAGIFIGYCIALYKYVRRKLAKRTNVVAQHSQKMPESVIKS